MGTRKLIGRVLTPQAGVLVHPGNLDRRGRQSQGRRLSSSHDLPDLRCDLIIVDDIAMLPTRQDAAEAFYRIIDAAYERHSIAVTSNIHPNGFDSIMPKTLTTTTADRLLHHTHLLTTKGKSHRLAEATAGKGVVALT